jgi:hypothetical protein
MQDTIGQETCADYVLRRLKQEREEALAVLSGRTVSCSQCNEAAEKIASMREAIKDASVAIAYIYKPLGDETEDRGNPCVAPKAYEGRAIGAALAKLQPFVTAGGAADE